MSVGALGGGWRALEPSCHLAPPFSPYSHACGLHVCLFALRSTHGFLIPILVIPIGVWKSFMLRGLADAPVSGLRVLPASWTFGANGWTGYDQIVVSFRRATDTNMDAGLQPPYRNKVS